MWGTSIPRGKSMRKITHAEAKAIKRPGMYRADVGLYLRVGYAGGRSWIQRIKLADGRRHDIGLGSFSLMSLAEARDMAHENRRAARIEKRDILTERRQPAVPTFEQAAEAVLAIHEPTWKDGGKTARLWQSTLRDYAMPKLGRKLVTDISSSDLLSVVVPIWNEMRPTATKVKRRIGAIMKWAIAEGYRLDNPVDSIGAALPKSGGSGGHFKALPYDQVGAAIEQIKASGAFPSTIMALELAILTATRSSESRLARHKEFDLDKALWEIPSERTKMCRPHRIPLSTRALEILHEAKELFGDEEELVFPGARGKKLSDNTLSKLLRTLEIAGTPHGIARASFRSWCAATGKPRELAEMALGHVTGQVEAAYQRDDMLQRRWRLMQQWNDYLAGTAPAKVIELRQRNA